MKFGDFRRNCGQEVEHQLDKVAALEELCRLHELPLAQALGATIRQQLGQRQ